MRRITCARYTALHPLQLSISQLGIYGYFWPCTVACIVPPTFLSFSCEFTLHVQYNPLLVTFLTPAAALQLMQLLNFADSGSDDENQKENAHGLPLDCDDLHQLSFSRGRNDQDND